MRETFRSRRSWTWAAVFMLVTCLCRFAWAGDADPGGNNTGKGGDAMSAGGDTLILTAPDSKDPKYAGEEGKKKYDSDKKNFDEYKAKADREPLAVSIAEGVGQNRIAINMVWTLVTGFLVMFMQAGFALLETGLCRAKNASHTMWMNIFIYVLGVTGFWLAGFAIMYSAMPVATLGGTGGLDASNEFTINLFGKPFGLFGTKGFCLANHVYDVGVYVIFLFQVVFMDTAATIPTGAMAERWKLWPSFFIYGFFMSIILYPIFGNWAWGGGWLSTLGTNFGLGHGYVDFAGSGVVHTVGGLCGLAGALVLRPRLGRYNKDGSANAMPAHHIPMVVLGTLILAFGWFGFNPGSTLAASGGGFNRIGIIATSTMVASVAGAFSAAIYMMATTGKPDTTMICNGLLAGLVAITAPSGFVGGPAAFVIGLIAGVIVCIGVKLFDKIHVDDPCGAISVHGLCGLWGVLSVGIFADGTAFYTGAWNGVNGTVKGLIAGDTGQFVAQCIGCVTLIFWAFGLSYVFFKVIDKLFGMRVSAEVEFDGLDLHETGVLAYPSFSAAEGAAALAGASAGVHSIAAQRSVSTLAVEEA